MLKILDRLTRQAPTQILDRTDQSEEANLCGLHAHWHKPQVKRYLAGRNPEVTLKKAVTLLREPANFRSGKAPLWWVGVGTALGASRDGGFIQGDTDIDFRIGLDYRKPKAAYHFVCEVAALFERHGFKLFRETSWNGRPMQTAFMDQENNEVVVDIYYFYDNHTADRWTNYNEYGYREKPGALIRNMQKMCWPGRDDILINTPGPVEEYNEWRFGPEWRTPKKNSELTAIDNQCIKPLPPVTVLTYGTFDLFHYGHYRLLKRAKALGQRLVVVVVSDELCQIKGKRPQQNEEERVAGVRASGLADVIRVQEMLDQKREDIERFKVKMLVVGSDWRSHPRFEAVRGFQGVELAYLSRTWFVSSTAKRKLHLVVGRLRGEQ